MGGLTGNGRGKDAKGLLTSGLVSRSFDAEMDGSKASSLVPQNVARDGAGDVTNVRAQRSPLFPYSLSLPFISLSLPRPVASSNSH